jgi:ADP-heptose:LPS heptosyltransferase
LALLRNLDISQESLAKAWPSLAPPSDVERKKVRALLGSVRKYHVLHPASSTATRDWRPENWELLAQNLLARGITPVITGRGARDREIADQICAAAPGAISTVDEVSWSGLVALIGGAEAVYAVETSVGHVASALRRPLVSLYGGMADPCHWAPLGASVVTNVTPCHPCLNKSGCATRECLTEITAEDVISAANAALLDHR